MKPLLLIVEDLPEWECLDKSKTWSPVGKMDWAEPLIAEYNLVEWMNPLYLSSTDVNKKCIPKLKNNYRGIIRVKS